LTYQRNHITISRIALFFVSFGWLLSIVSIPIIVSANGLPVSTNGNSFSDQTANSGVVQNPQSDVGGGLQPNNPTLQPTSATSQVGFDQTTINNIDSGTTPLHVVNDTGSSSTTTVPFTTIPPSTHDYGVWILLSVLCMVLAITLLYLLLSNKQQTENKPIVEPKINPEIVALQTKKELKKKKKTAKNKKKSNKHK